jgi:hypothetical protein
MLDFFKLLHDNNIERPLILVGLIIILGGVFKEIFSHSISDKISRPAAILLGLFLIFIGVLVHSDLLGYIDISKSRIGDVYLSEKVCFVKTGESTWVDRNIDGTPKDVKNTIQFYTFTELKDTNLKYITIEDKDRNKNTTVTVQLPKLSNFQKKDKAYQYVNSVLDNSYIVSKTRSKKLDDKSPCKNK